MKIQLVILPLGPILVSDEPINDFDYVLTEKHGVWRYKPAPCSVLFWGNKEGCKKVIAGIGRLPSVDLTALTDDECKKIGWVDSEYITIEELLQSPSQPKVYDVEVEMEHILCNGGNHDGKVCTITMCWNDDESIKDKCLGWCEARPKITNNTIKVTKIL